MKRFVLIPGFLGLCLALLLTSCSQSSNSPTSQSRDQVFSSVIHDIRLGDGVPVSLRLATRWRISDYRTFSAQFSRTTMFDSLVLWPRQFEIANQAATEFPSVDSVFGNQRSKFIATIKEQLLSRLGEDGVEIKEVIISNIQFPAQYTEAKESIGMKEQELERIRQKNIVDVAAAEAAKVKAEADGKVAIVQAKQEGELQKIQSETETHRRQIELARAETERQVIEKQAVAEARKQELLNQAELDKIASLNNLEVKKKRDMDVAGVDQVKLKDKVDFERQIELAKLCQDNPVYASFMVNKELASKVQIAVLPTGQEGSGVFGDILRQGMPKVGN
ncbi:MAG: hypothetical protein H6581_04305 [Bacteroidia bacterium]|nr:hypothetical protein [Bacteroidia bacterium]